MKCIYLERDNGEGRDGICKHKKAKKNTWCYTGCCALAEYTIKGMEAVEKKTL